MSRTTGRRIEIALAATFFVVSWTYAAYATIRAFTPPRPTIEIPGADISYDPPTFELREISCPDGGAIKHRSHGEVCCVLDGDRHGPCLTIHEVSRTIRLYEHGETRGPNATYHKDGSLLELGPYDGHFHEVGTWWMWYPSGQLRSRTTYQGSVVENTAWHENGQLAEQLRLTEQKDGSATREYCKYSTDGELLQTENSDQLDCTTTGE